MNLDIAALGDNAQTLVTMLIAYIPNLLAAFALLFVGWIIAGSVRKATVKGLERSGHVDATLRPFIGNLVRYAILAVVIVAVLGQFGIETASILAVLGAAGLAIGLALQGTLSNIAAGLMLLWLRPFKVGESIETDNTAGTIDEIGLFTTTIISNDGLYQVLPNSMLWNSRIRNFSRMPKRRLEVTIGIGYGDDVSVAKQAIRSIIDKDERFLQNPEPQIFLANLGDSTVDIKVRAWTSTADYWPTRFGFIEKIKLSFDTQGISFPFPQREVRVLENNIQMSAKP